MIREFHDEIQRLREQLSNMQGGGKMRPKGAPGQVNPATGMMEQPDTLTYEVDEAKMKEM